MEETMLPEISSPLDTKPSEPIAPGEEILLQAIPVQELAIAAPASVQKQQSSKRNVAAILLGLLTFLLLVAVTGLGVWGYTLNTRLNATQQQLITLQGEHAKLQADFATLTGDKEKLTNDLTQTKTDLDKANADLATAQADLKKSQDENKALTAQISKSSKYADILYTWFTSNNPSDIFRIDSQITAAKDSKLTSLWNKLTSAPSEDKFGELFTYLVTALRDELR
jgi:septal ring factor EnvC (AmiA/AmiB activator)